MFFRTCTLTLALLLAGCGGDEAGNGSATASAGPIEAIPAPNGGDWTQVVAATPEGGFRMGNPDAPVKLVEYASMTCPHCAEFAAEGVQPLTDKYVKTGRVSFEIRNFVRDSADIAAAMLARCGGPTPYFKLTELIFGAQDQWVSKLQNMPQEEQQRLQTLPPAEAVRTMAEKAGLIDFVRVRGVPASKANQCLSDKAEIDRLVAMAQKATSDYPDFPGTPTFTINGKIAPQSGTWEALEPNLRAAIG
jgi:protein-disulfide isomerase